MENRRISPAAVKAVIAACDMITPYGQGTAACWEGLHRGTTAITKVHRFATASFQAECAATIENLTYHQGDSLVMQMINALFAGSSRPIPRDARLLLATTKGEIDLLEKLILDGRGGEQDYNPEGLLEKIAARAGIRDRGMIISAACASSAAALTRATLMIKSGHADCILVVACDSVTEFVFSGFSSLMAFDRAAAKPFDKNRSGLSLGEAAAYVLLMSEERAQREEWEIIAEVAGCGLSDDANHMTGPSRSSEGMIRAICAAFALARCSEQDVGFISAHGTGTVYNDAMELRAFREIFKSGAVPLYSIKGGLGHTMGTAGLVEAIIALRALRERRIPPTVNLKSVDKDAQGWASPETQTIGNKTMALVTNAGFSGINSALALAG